MLRIAVIAAALLAFTGAPQAQSYDGYSIMKPEPGMKPRLKKRTKRAAEARETRQAEKPAKMPAKRRNTTVYPAPPSPRIDPAEGIVRVPPQQSVGRRPTQTPPDIVLPGIPRSYPNMPAGARETGQDRATRCTHQAGTYGVPGDQRNTYIGTCVNQ